MENLPATAKTENNSIENIKINEIFTITQKFIDEDNDLNLTISSASDFLDLFWQVKILSRHRTKPFSPHTLKAYKADGNSLLEFLNEYNIELKNIGFQQVKTYSWYINEKYAIKSAIRKLDFFRKLLIFGAQTHYYPKDYSVWIEKPASFKGHYSSKDVKAQREQDSNEFIRTRELNEKDARIILDFFEDVVKDIPQNKGYYKFLRMRNKLIGLILFGTGMRASEILSLTFGSFQKAGGALYAEVVGKGRKQRSVPILSQNLINLLEEFKTLVKEKYDLGEREIGNIPLFFSPAREKDVKSIKHMHYSNLQKLVKNAVNLAEKNPDISPHWFRHTYITFLLEHNVPLATVMDNAGHSNIATTNIYLEKINAKKKHKHMSHVDFD